MLWPMKYRQSGFTLIELLVVVAIAAVLISLATPSFQSMMVRRSVQSAADALVGDLRFARSEAVKRTDTVVVCSSSSGNSCLVTASWKDGWVVFVDKNANGAIDAGEDILRVQQVLPNIASIASTNPPGDNSRFSFQALGWAKAANQTFFITPAATGFASSARLVCLSSTGRAALRAKEDTSCT